MGSNFVNLFNFQKFVNLFSKTMFPASEECTITIYIEQQIPEHWEQQQYDCGGTTASQQTALHGHSENGRDVPCRKANGRILDQIWAQGDSESFKSNVMDYFVKIKIT
jgi:hypothetical protein